MKSLLKAVLITLAFLFFTSSIGLATSPYNTFKTVIYTGTGSEQSIAGLGFKPDLIWIKLRDDLGSHRLFDATRGAGEYLMSDQVNNVTTDATSLISYDEDGFTLGASGSSNWAGHEYVAWCWKAGQDGIADSTQTERYSLDSGLSIIKYTGDGASGRTVQHSLGAEPNMVIVKALNSTEDWRVYHDGLTSASYHLKLNTAGDESAVAGIWNNTNPTNTSITLGADLAVNANGQEFIAYVFSEISGTSALGSYTGNGSTNGPTIECGFEPAYVIIKSVNVNYDWTIFDSHRGTSGNDPMLYANEASSESTTYDRIEFTPTGFKLKTDNNPNVNNIKFIYMAFAEYESPQISFTSDVPSVDYGADPSESAVLSWSVSYGDNIAIEPGGFTSVDPAGTLTVTPDCPTTYTLTVTVGEEIFTEQVFVNATNGHVYGRGFSVKGPMGIGVLNPTKMLEVNGTIKAKEVIVTNEGWADYVFGETYELPALSSVENHIRTHRHLPGIPSADQIGEKGLSVSKMFELQMKKIEELTLYVLELSKENEELEQRLNALE